MTGESSGLGVDLARALAHRGHGVTLVARRKEPLEALAAELSDQHGVRVEAPACDLGDSDARDRLAAAVADLGLTVEILVNNVAGYGSGPFAGLDRDHEVAMVRLYCEAVIDLCDR